MVHESTNIVIGGEAGQGLVTIGGLLAKGLARHGYSLVVTQGYQSRIRGGLNTFAIRVSADMVEAPREAIDLLIAFTPEAIEANRDALADHALVIAGAGQVPDGVRGLGVPFEELGDKRYLNTAALGVVAQLLGLRQAEIDGVIENAFGKKDVAVREANRLVLNSAYRWAERQGVADFALSAPSAVVVDRLLLNGNEAIAFGAMASGLKFLSFYPMTPATSVVLAIAAHAQRMGIVVEQAEDEIAAVNMALGAAYAGAPAMVSTSGGGFALMTEGVSLAAMIETPLVFVIAQRPGPATGLPTRTEQADLDFVLHAGHGEFPRAIFAPGDIEECFYLTNWAFEVAEASQSPVFILTDQFLADSLRAVTPFDLAQTRPVKAGADPKTIDGVYERFAMTPTGVSPRLVPGASEHLVVVDSDEHTADGHLTEDLDVRVQMADKRLRKMEVILKRVKRPTYEGGDAPDLLLVSWGSTKGACREAAQIIGEKGIDVAVMHFSQVWPLIPDSFIDRLRAAKRCACVEGNAFGQFARLVRRETGFHFSERVLRYDGLPMTPAYIVRALER